MGGFHPSSAGMRQRGLDQRGFKLVSETVDNAHFAALEALLGQVLQRRHQSPADHAHRRAEQGFLSFLAANRPARWFALAPSPSASGRYSPVGEHCREGIGLERVHGAVGQALGPPPIAARS